MSRLPEDLRLALEGLTLLKEKFLAPLSRLDQLLQVCVESERKIEDANTRLRTIHKEIEQEQQRAAQQADRSRERLKSLEEQVALARSKWNEEEALHGQKLTLLKQQLDETEMACAARRRELAKVTEDIHAETQRLTELRERIRHAQTMEP